MVVLTCNSAMRVWFMACVLINDNRLANCSVDVCWNRLGGYAPLVLVNRTVNQPDFEVLPAVAVLVGNRLVVLFEAGIPLSPPDFLLKCAAVPLGPVF